MNKQEAFEFLNTLPEGAEVDITLKTSSYYVPAGYIIKNYNVSRQLLSYWVKEGYVKTVPYGKQKRYYLSDIEELQRK